jgi:hypothetical protein
MLTLETSGQTRKAAPATVYYSAALFRDASPDVFGPPFNSSRFDYGYGPGPQDNLTSVHSGFAGFRWNLARNLLVFPADLARSSIITVNSTIEAGYCLFYINMQFISARVQDGLYEEHILNTSTLIHAPQKQTSGSGLSTYRMSDTEHDLLTFKQQPICEKSKQSDDCVRSRDIQALNITIPRQRYINVVAALGKILPTGNLTTNRQSGLSGSAPGAELLYRAPNITKTMHTIAHYMTVALRANDTVLAQQKDPNNATSLPISYVAPSHRVIGTVYVQVVLLHVRWGWLAFPAALVLLVATVLIETIRTSQSVGVWKGNPLAVILNTQWRPEAGMMGANTSDRLADVAKRLEATIVRDGTLESLGHTVAIRNRHEA